MSHDHAHKFDPANTARLDDPRRRELMPAAPLLAALGLRPGDRIADIGCGAGYWLFALREAAPEGVRFWAVDSTPAMLEHLATRLSERPDGPPVALVRSTEHEVTLPDGTLDVAVLGSVYHELADRAGYLAELHRLLAPGGRLAIIDWDALPPGVERTMGPPVDHRVPSAVAARELAAAGFEDVQSVEGFRESYALLARRRD